MGHFRKTSWWVLHPHDILRLWESCWEVCPFAPCASGHLQTAPGKTAAHIGDAFCHQSRHLCVCVCSVMFDSVQPHGPTRFLCPQDFPGKNTGVGCHFLLQGIFPTQVSNQHILYLLHWHLCLPNANRWRRVVTTQLNCYTTQNSDFIL